MARKPEDNSPAGNAARASIAAQQRAHRRSHRGGGEEATWGAIDPTLIHAAICAITGQGAAIQFGLTRDGGAYVIRVVGDGEPYNEYLRPTEDTTAYFTALALDFAK